MLFIIFRYPAGLRLLKNSSTVWAFNLLSFALTPLVPLVKFYPPYPITVAVLHAPPDPALNAKSFRLTQVVAGVGTPECRCTGRAQVSIDQSRIENHNLCLSLVFHIFLQTAKSIVSYVFLDVRRSLPRRNTVPHGDNQGCWALQHDPCQGIKSHSPCFTDARIGFNRCEQIGIWWITKSVGTVRRL